MNFIFYSRCAPDGQQGLFQRQGGIGENPSIGKEHQNWRRKPRVPVPSLFALPSAHAISFDIDVEADLLHKTLNHREQIRSLIAFLD